MKMGLGFRHGKYTVGAILLIAGWANAQIVPGQYIAVLKNNVVNPAAVAQQLTAAHGVQLGFVYEHALKGFSFKGTDAAAQAIARNPLVAFVEPDQVVHAFCHLGDPQVIPTGTQRVFADENPNITIDGVDDLRIDVDIAIIDTGIDLDHFDLNVVASTNCSGGSPFKKSCTDGGGDDDNGHGSHVAGSAAAIDNDRGVVGMAPGARLYAVKVLDQNGSGQISWIVAGIDWVTARADHIEVANMSLGCKCTSSSLNTAISNSVAAGVVYAVAAGNSDADAKDFSPANHPDVITVSALADFDGEPGGLGAATCTTDQDDTLADFSNWGSTVEITAPGVCILSTFSDGFCAVLSGTSMSSPHVAGAAALLASGANAPTNKAEVDAIIQTIINAGNFNWVDDSGDGIQEPLLDVSNSIVFAPATVPGTSQPACSVNADCNDGDACNGAETCVDGTCQPGTPVNCDDGNACTTDSCDPATGACSNDPISCDDGNVCTTDSCDPATGCVNTFPACGLADGCCGPGCDPSTDPDCQACGAQGDPCEFDSDCCENKCRGKTGAKTCK